MNAINKPNEVSMFKVGESVVLKNSSQNKVMKIQAHNDEFIRAYWSKKNTRLRMSQTLDTPHPKKSKQGVVLT